MGNLIALTVQNATEEPSHETLMLGAKLAALAGGDPSNVMFIRADSGPARTTMFSMMYGLSITAVYEPRQIRRLPELNTPAQTNFWRALLNAICAESVLPFKKVAVVIADREFIMGFLRYYFHVTGNGFCQRLDDFVRDPGIVVTIDTASQKIGMFQ
jgi:hypothetical protein